MFSKAEAKYSNILMGVSECVKRVMFLCALVFHLKTLLLDPVHTVSSELGELGQCLNHQMKPHRKNSIYIHSYHLETGLQNEHCTHTHL